MQPVYAAVANLVPLAAVPANSNTTDGDTAPTDHVLGDR